jgi:formamidopyrimidine-DNA glycosylase
VLCLEGDLFLVLHLMIAGRLQWRPAEAPLPRRLGLAALDFPTGTLLLTEAGSRKRASLYVVAGTGALGLHDPGGLEVMAADLPAFAAVLRRERHTLKRALTDPHLFSGIGNAYSDEILHRARLSPFKLTDGLDQTEMERLYAATQDVLAEWTARLRAAAGGEFPRKVTAFRPEMAALRRLA